MINTTLIQFYGMGPEHLQCLYTNCSGFARMTELMQRILEVDHSPQPRDGVPPPNFATCLSTV